MKTSTSPCKINALTLTKLMISSDPGQTLTCELALLAITQGEAAVTMAKYAVTGSWPWSEEVIKAANELKNAVESQLLSVYFGDEAAPQTEKPRGILFRPDELQQQGGSVNEGWQGGQL